MIGRGRIRQRGLSALPPDQIRPVKAEPQLRNRGADRERPPTPRHALPAG